MPPRKEPKEAVIYPASKRKTQPFKPQRPGNLIRTETTESRSTEEYTERDSNSLGHAKTTIRKDHREAARPARASSIAASDFDVSDLEQLSNISSDDLPDDPLKAATVTRRPLCTTVQGDETMQDDEPALLPEARGTEIPQALLLRLMHEHFESKDTQIDKHAIKLVQRYVEIFLHESIARAALAKKAEPGAASQNDQTWLDKNELEQIAATIALDF